MLDADPAFRCAWTFRRLKQSGVGSPAAGDLEQLAAGARALGDATRLSIALALREAGTAYICDLGWVVGRDQKLVSHHARLLKANGLARSQRDGKMVLYELTDRGRALVDNLAAPRAAP